MGRIGVSAVGIDMEKTALGDIRRWTIGDLWAFLMLPYVFFMLFAFIGASIIVRGKETWGLV